MPPPQYCTSCIRSLQRQTRQYEFNSRQTSSRLLSITSRTSLAQPAPLPYAKKFPSPAPVSPSNPPPTNQGAISKPQITLPANASPIQKIAKTLRERNTAATETYVAYGVCEELIKECARKADYTIPQAAEKGIETPKTKDGEDLGVGKGWWYEELGLTPTFNTWAQITFLHMYLLTVRFRMFPASIAQSWHQHLANHFFYVAEERMTTLHKVHAASIRNKYLKDLFVQWRGLTAGYDEGLVKGDAVLAAAVWRNIFKAREDVDLLALGKVVGFIREALRALDSMPDELVTKGNLMFQTPGERGSVKVKSPRIANDFEDPKPELQAQAA